VLFRDWGFNLTAGLQNALRPAQQFQVQPEGLFRGFVPGEKASALAAFFGEGAPQSGIAN
jgi:hypothetical protein